MSLQSQQPLNAQIFLYVNKTKVIYWTYRSISKLSNEKKAKQKKLISSPIGYVHSYNIKVISYYSKYFKYIKLCADLFNRIKFNLSVLNIL